MTVKRLLIIVMVSVLPALASPGVGGPSSADRRPRPAPATEESSAGNTLEVGEVIEWGRRPLSGDLSAARRPRRRAAETPAHPEPEPVSSRDQTSAVEPEPILLPEQASVVEPEPVLPQDLAAAIEPGTEAQPWPTAVEPPPPPPPAAQYGRVPPYFIRNDGQLPDEVGYYHKGPLGTVYLTKTELVFDFFSGRPETPDQAIPPGEGAPAEKAEETVISRLVFRLRFPGADPGSVLEGRGELPGKINYFVGGRENWRTSIPTYEKVVYRGLYPGIDLACLFADGNLACRYTVAPGADPGRIVFSYSGVDGLEINPGGDLIVLTAFGGFPTPAPRAYQEIAGQRAERKAAFVLSDAATAALKIAPYDRAHPLVIEF